MRHAAFTAIMFTAAIAGCQTLPEELGPQDYSVIEAASADWVAAYNANDWELLASYFTSDAILMPPNGPAVTGRENIAAWEAENETGYRIALDIENIGGSGDTAYVRGRSCVFIPLDEGEYGVDAGKFLEVRKLQEDGAWLVDVDIFNSDTPEEAGLQAACPFADGWE